MSQTNEQDIILAKSNIANLKSIYMQSLTKYIQSTKLANNEIKINRLLTCQKKGNEYFNYAEEFVGNSDLLGAHNSALWAQGFAEDCAEILMSLPSHIELLTQGFSKCSAPFNLSTIIPGNTAFANMQRMVLKYLNIDEVNNVKESFEKAGLPIYGFKNEAKEFMSKKLQTILSFIFGTVFVIVSICIALIVPNPSNFQQTVFRVVLALAGGGTVATFPGFMEVKFGNWLRAGGALAVFAIIYFMNPAMAQTNGPQLDPVHQLNQLPNQESKVENPTKSSDKVTNNELEIEQLKGKFTAKFNEENKESEGSKNKVKVKTVEKEGTLDVTF